MSEQLPPPKKDRLIFIDVMRGIAVLWMIETHVIDVVLKSVYKSGFIYNMTNLSNGFVAVSFLFCAGAGFWLAAMKKADDYKHFRAPLWVYLRRLGLILIIAYWLHFPALSLQKFFLLDYAGWLRFFECDVLQTIVYSSLIALIILMVTPKIKYLPYIFAVLALIVFLAAPFVWCSDPLMYMPPFFGALFAKFPISKFPLLPWSGYFFAGTALTAYFMSYENKKKLAQILAIVSVSLVFIIYNFNYYLNFYPSVTNWWHTSPFHSLFRVCGAIGAFSILFLLEKWYKDTRFGNAMKLCGQESLYVYVSHNMLVYGSIANYGMRTMIGNRLEVPGTILIIIGVAIGCYVTALGWNVLKAKDIKRARLVMAGIFALFVIIFLVNPA